MVIRLSRSGKQMRACHMRVIRTSVCANLASSRTGCSSSSSVVLHLIMYMKSHVVDIVPGHSGKHSEDVSSGPEAPNFAQDSLWRTLDAAPSSHLPLSFQSHLFLTPITRPNIVINIRACRSGASLSSPRMGILMACEYI
jgi:hypothetical protein